MKVKMKRLLCLFCSLVACFQVFSQKMVVAKDGSGNYRTVQEAIDAIPVNNKKQWVIFVKNGVYKEKVVVDSSKMNISIIGENRDSTIITFDDHAKKNNMGTSKSYTMLISGSNIRLIDLTIENNAEPVAQAVALHVNGTRVSVFNCRLLGNQDTLYTNNENSFQYYQDCYIEGTTDFIFGPATAWFENCTIHSKKDSYITAASTSPNRRFGYVFNNCKLTSGKGVAKVYLGRPWRPYAATLFMNCYLGSHILPEGWHNWNKPESEHIVRYAEYNSTGPGSNTKSRVAWSKQLDKKAIKEYNLKIVFPGWKPKNK
jgi:pectinesterase